MVEAGVQQMKNGVLDTSDVLIYREPVVGSGIKHGIILIFAGKTRKIPG